MITDIKEFKRLQIENEKKLLEFLEFLEMAICKRCWEKSFLEVCRPHHTHGGLLEALYSLKINKTDAMKWIFELEHGFLHGFMVLYFAFTLHPDKQNLWDTVFFYNERKVDYPRIKDGDRFIVSALMHDYFKTQGIVENHDIKLKELSDIFDPDIYNHSCPTNDECNNPLIWGDRLELMRYKDCKEWCDFALINPCIEKYGKELIGHFFQHIRPIICKMFLHRWDIWVSHILEIDWQSIVPIKDNKNIDFYPKSHWLAKDEAYASNVNKDINSYFSVNMGKLPYDGCISHAELKHGPIGIISLSSLKENGCELRPAPPSTCGRDHLFVVESNKINLDKWCFIYDEITQVEQFDQDDFHVLSKGVFNKIYSVSDDFLTKFMAIAVI